MRYSAHGVPVPRAVLQIAARRRARLHPVEGRFEHHDRRHLHERAHQPFDLDQDKGPDATDQRHNVVLNSSYLLPLDFQLAGMFVWRSARPWAVFTYENPEGYVFRPLPEGKNTRRGDSEKTVDLRVSKTFRFGRGASATVFWEMFNTFNWTNFTAYDGLMESPNFGLPTTAGEMRRQQLGFRLDF